LEQHEGEYENGIKVKLEGLDMKFVKLINKRGLQVLQMYWLVFLKLLYIFMSG